MFHGQQGSGEEGVADEKDESSHSYGFRFCTDTGAIIGVYIQARTSKGGDDAKH